MTEIHPVQLQILKVLLFKPKARFSDLNTTGLTNDHFTFHLKQLQQVGLIEKTFAGYKLTPSGMELAGRIDVDSDQIVTQPKLGVAVCLLKREQTKISVLLNKRHKDQAIGRVGLHTEKVRFGEKLTQTAERCIQREIGDIEYKLQFAGVSHTQSAVGSELENDVVHHCFRVDYVSGEVMLENLEGANFWVNVTELDSVVGIFPHIKQIVEHMLRGETFFYED